LLQEQEQLMLRKTWWRKCERKQMVVGQRKRGEDV
jgi:hypothetical protein